MIWYWECNGIFVANCKYETTGLQWENGINHLPKAATLLEPQSLVGVGRHDDYGSHVVHLVLKIPLSLSWKCARNMPKLKVCWVLGSSGGLPCSMLKVFRIGSHVLFQYWRWHLYCHRLHLILSPWDSCPSFSTTFSTVTSGSKVFSTLVGDEKATQAPV